MSHTKSNEVPEVLDRIAIKRALVSVWDKTGLEPLAKALHDRSVELYSTGGTEKFLTELGLPVHSVSEMTEFPEILDGRVKTLHPKVHGGLLFRRELMSHRVEAASQGIEPIDLLITNLYPFEMTRAKAGATEEEIIQQIDIGGPAMLRSASKNFNGVAVLTNPGQYAPFLEEFEAGNGALTRKARFKLAEEAFHSVAKYDVAIAKYFFELSGNRELPDTLLVAEKRIQPLRYGENPHQMAGLYGDKFTSIFRQLWGKELSHINIQDCSAASSLILDFADSDRTVAAIFKHTTPCGVAEGNDALGAFDRAFRSDPESPFGGVIILNRNVSAGLAKRLNEFFSEILLAPGFDEEALEILKKKKDRRLVEIDLLELKRAMHSMLDIRSVPGGLLVQEPDKDLIASEVQMGSSRALDTNEQELLQFAWKCVKHVKSNAIVYAGLEHGFARTLGIGGGQTSRVESSRLAVRRAAQFGHSLQGSVVASDAYFPFADGLIEAIKAGAMAVIQPGGSIRDAEVIAEAEKHGIPMVLTGMRHFKH